MRNRIAAAIGGIVLAVAGWPAAPASAAAGTTCANLYTATDFPDNNDVIARACITWNDAPSGSRWTMSEQRIWNPPGGVNYAFFVDLYDNTGRFNGFNGNLTSGQTKIGDHSSVGQLTAKFDLLVDNYSSTPFCIYLVPGGSNIEHHGC
jgi:hypothetical protein